MSIASLLCLIQSATLAISGLIVVWSASPAASLASVIPTLASVRRDASKALTDRSALTVWLGD
jgi:hypothetical protein